MSVHTRTFVLFPHHSERKIKNKTAATTQSSTAWTATTNSPERIKVTTVRLRTGHSRLGHQFSSRWYLCARKSPYALHPVCQKFPQRRLGNSSNVRLIDDGCLVLSRNIVSRFLFPRLSHPGDRWRDVLGFVPAGSVSSFSTLQIFREVSRL